MFRVREGERRGGGDITPASHDEHSQVQGGHLEHYMEQLVYRESIIV